MTKFARDNMLRGIMKQAWIISERVGVDIGNALKVSWGTMWHKIPIKHTKIVGVSFEGRQTILKQVLEKDIRFSIFIKRERTNIHDHNAIAVYPKVPQNYRYEMP